METLGEWTQTLVETLFHDGNKCFLYGSLNLICGNFFPVKELKDLMVKRLPMFDDDGKKLTGLQPLRFQFVLDNVEVLRIDCFRITLNSLTVLFVNFMKHYSTSMNEIQS